MKRINENNINHKVAGIGFAAKIKPVVNKVNPDDPAGRRSSFTRDYKQKAKIKDNAVQQLMD
ncbi:MAG: hypothetical protein K0R59_784 [Sphingobacterium sp.]|jgi:hypothetical protein|nr:hypothetical protein [Sphingobacterium sp.]